MNLEASYKQRLLDTVERIETEKVISRYRRKEGKNKVVIVTLHNDEFPKQSIQNQVPSEIPIFSKYSTDITQDIGSPLNDITYMHVLGSDADVVLFLYPDTTFDKQVLEAAELVDPTNSYQLMGVPHFESLGQLKTDIKNGNAENQNKTLKYFIQGSISANLCPQYGVSKQGWGMGSIVPLKLVQPFVAGPTGGYPRPINPRQISALMSQDVRIDSSLIEKEADLLNYLSHQQAPNQLKEFYGWVVGHGRKPVDSLDLQVYNHRKVDFKRAELKHADSTVIW